MKRPLREGIPPSAARLNRSRIARLPPVTGPSSLVLPQQKLPSITLPYFGPDFKAFFWPPDLGADALSSLAGHKGRGKTKREEGIERGEERRETRE